MLILLSFQRKLKPSGMAFVVHAIMGNSWRFLLWSRCRQTMCVMLAATRYLINPAYFPLFSTFHYLLCCWPFKGKETSCKTWHSRLLLFTCHWWFTERTQPQVLAVLDGNMRITTSAPAIFLFDQCHLTNVNFCKIR